MIGDSNIVACIASFRLNQNCVAGSSYYRAEAAEAQAFVSGFLPQGPPTGRFFAHVAPDCGRRRAAYLVAGWIRLNKQPARWAEIAREIVLGRHGPGMTSLFCL